MTVDVVHFPAGLYPSVQRLTPDVGPGQSVMESPFIGAQTVHTYRGAERWRLEMTLADLTGADRGYAMAFATKLRVSHNVFLCVNHTAPQRGNLAGTPLALGSLNGHYLVVGNLTASVANWARAGDFVSVNCALKMVLDDVGTDASGIASLHVWPPIYDIAASGTVVKTSSPCGAFRAVSAIPMNTDPPGYRTSLSIVAVERVNSSFVSDFL